MKSELPARFPIVVAAVVALAGWPGPLMSMQGGLDNVRIQRVDGSTLQVSIAKIDTAGLISGEGIPADLTLDQIVSIETDKKPSTISASGIRVHTVDGGNLMASQCEIANERITIRSGSGIEQLPLETITGIVWKDSEKVRQLLEERSTDNDAVVVQTDTGERVVSGILETVTPERISISYRGQSRNISFEKVQVNAIIIADLQLKKATGTGCQLLLLDGSTVSGVLNSFDGEEFAINTTGGHSLSINRSKLAGIRVSTDRLAFLSDLEPLDVRQRTQFTVQRPWQRDRSIEGNPLRLRVVSQNREQSFNKGIGTQSYSEIVFENPGFDRFQATVGIDAETRGRGDCKMIVRGDGAFLWSQRIRASEDPVQVSVDISGIRKVALVVQPGEQFDLADHANWANARFTKSK